MGGASQSRDRVRFGPAGWSYPDWVGPVYPRDGARGGRHGDLESIAACFDVAEVNSTFYRSPSPDVARGWLRKVSHNPSFQFTAKVWRGFTHERNFAPSDVRAFREGVGPVHAAGRLGALLMQFPWSFKHADEAWRHVRRVAVAFGDLPLTVEFRHASWDRPEVRSAMKDEGLGFCNVDQPDLPGCLAPTEHVTTAVAYVRLHGRNRDDWFRPDAGRDARYNYRYTLAELRPWIGRIRAMSAAAKRVFVVTNNHFGGSAVANALELSFLYRGALPPLPAHWLNAFPELRALGPLETRGQLGLFR